MPDTNRTIVALQALFADDASISAQDLRDFLVSAVNLLDDQTITGQKVFEVGVAGGDPLIIRQTGGVAGTDEMQVSHSGTDGLLESKSGGLQLKAAGSVLLDIGASGNNFSTLAYNNWTFGSIFEVIDSQNRVSIANGVRLYFNLGTLAAANPDVDIARSGVGVLKIGNASTGGGTLSSPANTQAQFTTNQDDLTLTTKSWFQRWSSDASRNITGIVAGVDGQKHRVWNVGNFNIVFMHQVTSTAANRFICDSGADLTLTPGNYFDIEYDLTSTRWYVASHVTVGGTQTIVGQKFFESSSTTPLTVKLAGGTTNINEWQMYHTGTDGYLVCRGINDNQSAYIHFDGGSTFSFGSIGQGDYSRTLNAGTYRYGNTGHQLDSEGFNAVSNKAFYWMNSTGYNGTRDTSLARISAGVIGCYSGTGVAALGTFVAGDLRAQHLATGYHTTITHNGTEGLIDTTFGNLNLNAASNTVNIQGSTLNCESVLYMSSGGIVRSYFDGDTFCLNSASHFRFNSSTNLGGGNTGDIGQIRAAAGVLGVTNGSTGGGTISSPANTQTQFTGNQDDLALTTKSLFQRWSSDASRNVTGIVAGVDGQKHRIWNVGSFNIVFMHNVTSTAANRFTCDSGVDLTLTPGNYFDIEYDLTSTRWRVASHVTVGGTQTIVGTKIFANGGLQMDDGADSPITFQSWGNGVPVTVILDVSAGPTEVLAYQSYVASNYAALAGDTFTGQVIFETGAAGASPVIFRQTGGVAGTDELQISNNGTNSSIEHKDASGNLKLISANGIRFLVQSSIYDLSPNVFGLGNTTAVCWNNNSDGTTGGDTSIIRAAAGVVKFAQGSGSGAGTFSATANTQAQFTGNQDNLALTTPSLFQRWSSDASRNVTGIVAGVDGQKHRVWNVGSFNIVFMHQVTSTAANRFICDSGADLTLTPGNYFDIEYDLTTTRWYVASHVTVGGTQTITGQKTFNTGVAGATPVLISASDGVNPMGIYAAGNAVNGNLYIKSTQGAAGLFVGNTGATSPYAFLSGGGSGGGYSGLTAEHVLLGTSTSGGVLQVHMTSDYGLLLASTLPVNWYSTGNIGGAVTADANGAGIKYSGSANTLMITDGASAGGTLSFIANTQTQFTGNQDNLALTTKSWFQRWSSDASRNVTGIVAGADGQKHRIWNVGSFNIVFMHQVTSTAANRFICDSGADLTLTPGNYFDIEYDLTSTRWRVASHVTVGGAQTITGLKTFSSVAFNGGGNYVTLQANSQTDNTGILQIPDMDTNTATIVTTELNHTINGVIGFTQNLLTGALNGVNDTDIGHTGASGFGFIRSKDGNLALLGTSGIVTVNDGSFPTLGVGKLLSGLLVEANTAVLASPNIILATESGTVFTNEGIAALNYHTLPTAVSGLQFTFIVQDGDGIRVVANTGDTIRLNTAVSAAAGYCEATAIGSVVTLVAINATEWMATSIIGTWTVT